MARQRNESPSPQQQIFIDALARGASQVEAARLAHYSGDRGNSARLARKMASEVAAAREKLNLPPLIKPEPEEIPDDEIRALVEQNRALYEAATAAGDIKSARKSLTALERLLKKKKPKASTSAPTAKPSSSHTPVDWNAVYDCVFTPEENAAYEAEIEAGREIERHRQLWLAGKPNQYMELQYPGNSKRVLPGGTQVIDFAEPAAEDSSVAMTQEVVRRL